MTARDPNTSLSGDGWTNSDGRIRRLQRLQIIVLALVCIGSVTLIGLLGNNLMDSAADQSRTGEQLNTLMEIRDVMVAQEAAIWRSRAKGSPLPLSDFATSYGHFREGALRMADEHAGGDGPDVTRARERVLSAVRDIDAITARLVTSGIDDARIDAALRATDEPADELRAGMREWIQAAAEAIRSANDSARRQSTRLVWSLTTLAGLILAGGVILTSRLDRTRARLVAILERSEERFRSLVQHSSDAVLVTDPAGSIRYASHAAERLFGHTPNELMGRPLSDLVHPDDDGPMSRQAGEGLDAITTGAPITWIARRADGSPVFLESVASDRTDDEMIGGVVLNNRDVTDRREMELTLEHRAFHDSLTDLPNRELFADRVDHALALMRRSGGMIAVLLLDLDDFKTVNDSLGHAAGDALLVEVADRLRATLREEDTPARLGGDEFAVLIESCGSPAEVQRLADRIGRAIREPMHVEGHTLATRASIGIRISDNPTTGAAEILRDADVAMYAAKGRGGSGSSLFDPEMNAQAGDRLALITDLDHAIERGELELHYQPAIDIRTRRIRVVEALVRWQRPGHGCVRPDVFIPLAEETGQIIDIGRWVLEGAIAQMADWNRRLPTSTSMRIAVNVSVRQLENPTFADMVFDTLRRHGMSADRLLLEVTEHALARNHEMVLANLHTVRGEGVQIAVDDFGTGYSSLAYLAELPIDVVKIDRTFVADLRAGRRSSRLAETIIRIGQSLNLLTVAEGVEDEMELDILRGLGCRHAQGYLISPPTTPDRLESSIATGTTGTALAGTTEG